MASIVKTKLSYQKLKNEGEFDEEKEENLTSRSRASRGWWSSRLRKLTGRKRRRPRVRIPGLRKFLRRKARFLSSVRVSWRKAMKRLKKSQLGYVNDLLGGNYLFMHVSCPAAAPIKPYGKKVNYMGNYDDLIRGLSSIM